MSFLVRLASVLLVPMPASYMQPVYARVYVYAAHVHWYVYAAYWEGVGVKIVYSCVYKTTFLSRLADILPFSKIIDARYQLSTVFSSSLLLENRWNPDNGRQLLWEWQYCWFEDAAICKVTGNRSTDFNGFLYQFPTGKSLKTVAGFPIILQSAVHSCLSTNLERVYIPQSALLMFFFFPPTCAAIPIIIEGHKTAFIGF